MSTSNFRWNKAVWLFVVLGCITAGLGIWLYLPETQLEPVAKWGYVAWSWLGGWLLGGPFLAVLARNKPNTEWWLMGVTSLAIAAAVLGSAVIPDPFSWIAILGSFTLVWSGIMFALAVRTGLQPT